MLNLASPGAIAAMVRPLIGLSFATMLVIIFRPLAMGTLRAGLLVLNPRLSVEQRRANFRFRGALMLNRMASNLEDTQPNLAAELRTLAARD
jgi:hypothetical protein